VTRAGARVGPEAAAAVPPPVVDGALLAAPAAEPAAAALDPVARRIAAGPTAAVTPVAPSPGVPSIAPLPGGDEPVTVDRFLAGRFHLIQPRKGFRCGSDAIVLASVLPVAAAGHLVDLGAGPGGVGFAAVARCPGLAVTCVERDRRALALAAASLGLAENAAFAARVRIVEGNIAEPPSAWSGAVPRASAVLMNPPYHAAGAGRRSPCPVRHAARSLGDEGLAPWFAAARRVLEHGGLLGVITPVGRLGEIVAVPSFGAVRVYPIHSRASEPALRVIVTARLGSRAPLTMMPPLVMHQRCGAFTEAAARILSGAASLDEVVLGR
jgi:tRNA1(Val) A37 N6-methylase TrmN6